MQNLSNLHYPLFIKSLVMIKSIILGVFRRVLVKMKIVENMTLFRSDELLKNHNDEEVNAHK